MIGVGATYILTKGAKEAELKETQTKLNLAEKRISELEFLQRQSDTAMYDSVQSKIENYSKLQNCLRKKDFYRFVHDNSFCFFRSYYNPHNNFEDSFKKSGSERKNIPGDIQNVQIHTPGNKTR